MADVAVVPPQMHTAYEDGKPTMTVVESSVLDGTYDAASLKADLMNQHPNCNGSKGYYRNEELGGPIHSERSMDVSGGDPNIISHTQRF